MALAFFLALGFPFTPSPNATCVDVIQALRVEERLDVVAASTVGETIVYLLTDKGHKKTAQVGCTLPN